MQGRIVRVLHGVMKAEEAAYRDLIEPYGEYKVVPDNGKAGRVLDELEDILGRIEVGNCSLYTIGPDPLMLKALDIAVSKGCNPAYCYASLETYHMCGIGICGECECGGVLSCKEGTFFDYTHLKKHYFKDQTD